MDSTLTAPDRRQVGDPAPPRAIHPATLSGPPRPGDSRLAMTWQAGRLVMFRDEGDHLCTHFRGFPAPTATGQGFSRQGSQIS